MTNLDGRSPPLPAAAAAADRRLPLEPDVVIFHPPDIVEIFGR